MKQIIIHETSNYSRFKLHKHNRDVNTNSIKYKNLVALMKEHGFSCEHQLGCEKKGRDLIVRGGHNRLAAAMELGIPVKYVITDTPGISIQDFEKAGPGRWTTANHLTSFCRQGYPHYVALKEYMDKTGISLQIAAGMHIGRSGSGGSSMEDSGFSDGKFEILETDLPAVVADMVLFLKELGINWAASARLVSALAALFHVKEFDFKRFKSKVTTYKYLMERQKDSHSYLDLIEEIFNRGTSKKVNISFLAKTETARRARSGLNKGNKK